MEGDQLGDVDVADAVAIGQAEGVVALNVLGHALEAPTGHGALSSVHQGHTPGFGATLVHVHGVLAHVESDIRHIEKVVGEVLLDLVALVAAADHKIIDSVGGINLHDVPKDRLATDFHHGFRLGVGLLGYPGAKAAGQNDCLHC